MAVMTLDFYSKELKMSTLLTVLLPDAVRMNGQPLAQRKCLTLLHGLSDDATAWLRLSRVELYAQETGVVVVMPSVGRSMYCDNVLGQNFFSHVANELPEYLHLALGLPRQRQLNYIAGVSMGGMGAAKVALTYPRRFRAVGLFSGLLDVKLLLPFVTEEQRREFPFLLEAAQDIDTSPLNPVNLLNAETQAGLNMLVRCGRQDDLYPMSLSFCQRAKALGLEVDARFGEGGHEWRLWDGYIDEFIAMMAEDSCE